MASVEDRIVMLMEEYLGISDRAMLDANASELGINSMDALLFRKMVSKEFGVTISPSDSFSITCMRDLIKHLEAQ